MEQILIQEAQPAGETLAEIAIRKEQTYRALSEQCKGAKIERDLAAEAAYEQGQTAYSGYKIIKAQASKTVTEDSVTDYDIEHGTDYAGAYIAYWRRNCPIKISAKSFEEFLDTIPELSEADRLKVLEAVMVEQDKDACDYRIIAPKKGVKE